MSGLHTDPCLEGDRQVWEEPILCDITKGRFPLHISSINVSVTPQPTSWYVEMMFHHVTVQTLGSSQKLQVGGEAPEIDEATRSESSDVSGS